VVAVTKDILLYKYLLAPETYNDSRNYWEERYTVSLVFAGITDTVSQKVAGFKIIECLK